MNKFFQSLKNKKKAWEYAKSMLVGATATFIDFFITGLFVFAICHKHFASFLNVFFGGSADGYSIPTSIFLTSTMLGFVVSFFYNYFLSIFFVFENGNVGKNFKGFLKFAFFALIGLGLTSLGSFLGYSVIGGNMWIVKIIVTLIVFVYNFVTRKFFIFNINLIKDDENTYYL